MNIAGDQFLFDGQGAKRSFHHASHREGMTGESFGATHSRSGADIRESVSKGVSLGSISSGGRSSMRVDVIDVGCFEPGIVERARDRIE